MLQMACIMQLPFATRQNQASLERHATRIYALWSMDAELDCLVLMPRIAITLATTTNGATNMRMLPRPLRPVCVCVRFVTSSASRL